MGAQGRLSSAFYGVIGSGWSGHGWRLGSPSSPTLLPRGGGEGGFLISRSARLSFQSSFRRGEPDGDGNLATDERQGPRFFVNHRVLETKALPVPCSSPAERLADLDVTLRGVE